MKHRTHLQWFPWSFSDVVLIVVLGGGGIALLIWLESLHRWWAQALGEYLVFFLMTGAGVGAYGGWALDGIDDDAEERKVGWQLVAIANGIPLLLVLGKHAYTTPVDAPGAWPRVADLTARLLVSARVCTNRRCSAPPRQDYGKTAPSRVCTLDVGPFVLGRPRDVDRLALARFHGSKLAPRHHPGHLFGSGRCLGKTPASIAMRHITQPTARPPRKPP